MTPPSETPPMHTYHRGLAGVALFGSIWIFVLVTLGAFTTSINAGMAFPDWPLSNGSLNPHGWLTDEAMFSEHAHRLSAGFMTLIIIVVSAMVWRLEKRTWLRKLALFSVILVVIQAVVGGLRVLLNTEIAAMLHACLAQALVCTVIAIAVACSRTWMESPVAAAPGVRRAGVVCCILLFLQLGIAAVMRHTYSGLAIPTFPWSTADGHLLPAIWSFQVGINFAHRTMALILTVALIWFAVLVWRQRTLPDGMRLAAAALVGLLALQIFLGAEIVRTYRDPVITTGHVLVGALTLATTFWLTWVAHRDAIES